MPALILSALKPGGSDGSEKSTVSGFWPTNRMRVIRFSPFKVALCGGNRGGGDEDALGLPVDKLRRRGFHSRKRDDIVDEMRVEMMSNGFVAAKLPSRYDTDGHNLTRRRSLRTLVEAHLRWIVRLANANSMNLVFSGW